MKEEIDIFNNLPPPPDTSLLTKLMNELEEFHKRKSNLSSEEYEKELLSLLERLYDEQEKLNIKLKRLLKEINEEMLPYGYQ